MNRIREMWRLMLLAYFTTMVHSQQQNARRPEYDNGHGWDIRLAVPGRPGADYPTLNAIPRTSFSCSGKSPGYYADVEAGCQVFRVCTLGATYGFQSFLCPNGTLFNQEVLVCDWWMNARCDRTRQLFNDNKDKFGNLKLGPQLMKDIKKMLTHPLRNPYNKTIMKSNLIVMQDYKPPTGQLFPNGALISGPERLPSNVYVPAKQRLGNFAQNSFHTGDLTFAASTPSSQYIPLSSNIIGPAAPRDVEALQPQIQNHKLVQKGFSGTVSHTSNGESANNRNTDYTNNRITQSSYNQQQNHNQRNTPVSQPISQHIQNNQSQRQLAQYNALPSNQNTNTNQHHTFIGNANGQIRANSVPQFPRAGNGYVDREAKQNLVSSNIIPPIGKTLKFSRIVQKSSTGNPKSRITFKTWIVRPSKTARLVVEPTPYTYNRPVNGPVENILVDTSTPSIDKGNPEAEDGPYTYNSPMLSNQQIRTTVDSPSIYLPPTEPTLSARLYSKNPRNSKQSLLYLAPTTYKPSSPLYVPPSEQSVKLSRQYLSPNFQSPQSIDYQSARLVATPTAPTIDFSTTISGDKKIPPFSLNKQHDTYTNHNNLSFSELLTKEKLDITVNNIVKDTNKLLKTASRDELNQYRENKNVADNPTANNPSAQFENYNYEQLTAQPTSNTKSEKIVATPSTDLEPPADTSPYNYENSNKLSNLPFFRESSIPTNTIERTVSLKITIPETIAQYIFNKDGDSDIDNLEILNTGSSNYLVLTNNNLEEHKGLIPIGKLIWDKNLNISNSQALVHSFLTDSLNTAKEYSNIAKQSIISPAPTQSQIQNLNNEVIDDITNKVSQLTSSQFSNNNQNSANFVLLPQKTRSSTYYRDNIKYKTDNLQQPAVQSHQKSSQFMQRPEQLYSSQLQILNDKNLVTNLQGNSEQLYSGQLYQLPVPEVTRQINNFQNYIQSSNARLTEPLATKFSHQNSNQDINANKIRKHSNTDVEIIPSEILPYPPARQPLQRTEEATVNAQENSGNLFVGKLLNTNNGITAQIQDKIFGTLPHPLLENKLVTYKKNKSYYLYSELEDNNNDNIQATNTNDQTNQKVHQQNAKLIHSNDLSNRVTFELFPSIGFELENEREKQKILDALKINDYRDSNQDGKTQTFDQRPELVTGVDYTVIHPTSKKQAESPNNINTILYRGPSSYLAPQSTVGSLQANQQAKSIANSRIEKFDDNNRNNGYPKATPVRQFSF